MAKRREQETAITEWLAAREGDMIDLLEKLVNTDSGSYDKPGVDAVATHLRDFLEGEGVACEQFGIDTHGDALRATVPAPGQGGNQPVVLMGHRDTVFPKGEPTRRPFTIDNGIAYGPGVADMKAGLVMNAFVLAAFARFGGAPAPMVGLFTGDEEIGSPTSRPYIEAEARQARVVFNSEPGRQSGNVVTGRKGGVFFQCEVTGKAAHSGAAYQDGASAIEELARKIQALHALTDLDRGQTVNDGLISGGQSVNTVAPNAECQIDLYAFNSDVSKQMPIDESGSLKPEGDATLLRDALEKITGRYAGMNVAGGLLLSDGVDTREDLARVDALLTNSR